MTEPAKVIPITETQEIENKAMQLPDKARLIIVDSNAGLEMADRTVKDLDAMIKEVDVVFSPLAKSAFDSHRKITGKWKEVKQPLEDAKVYLINQVKAYQRKVKEEIEAERKRLEDIARKEEEERRLQEAAQLEKEGNFEEAQAVIEEPIYVPTPVAPIETVKVDQRKYAIKARARVINKLDVIRTVANNPALLDLLEINISVANAKAKAFGKELGKVIKGLEYYEE